MRYKYIIIFLTVACAMVFGNAFSTIEGMFYPNDLVFRMPGVVEEAVCLEVIDGKTIEVKYTGLVEEEKTVELIGVDVSQFGSDAKTLLEKLIKGKTVYLSYDWEGESDGKVKAYVWRYFPNLSGGYHLMVNAILLANGYAVIDTEEYITTKMSAMLYETSDTAMKNKYGELKRFASEKPLKYSELEKEMKDYLYKYYWKVEPVATGTIGGPANTSDEFNFDFFFEYAQCHDGATSTASGSGACSSHDGVDYWLYRRNTNSDNYSSSEDPRKTAYLLAKYLIESKYPYILYTVEIPTYNPSFVDGYESINLYMVEFSYTVTDDDSTEEYFLLDTYVLRADGKWEVSFKP